MYQIDPDRDARFGPSMDADEDRKYRLIASGLDAKAVEKMGKYGNTAATAARSSTGSGIKMAGEGLAAALGGIGKLATAFGGGGAPTPSTPPAWQTGFTTPGLNLAPNAWTPNTNFNFSL